MKPDDNNVITKSNKLIEAKYKLSLREQRLILLLASFIQPEDKEFIPYKFTVADFYKWLGLKGKPKYKEIRQISEGLMSKTFLIKSGNKVTLTAWLSSVSYYDNEGIVELCFDPNVKSFLLQLKNEFTSYPVKNISGLKSVHSIRLYEILKQYFKIGHREIYLKDLREMFGLTTEYPEYANFKQKVLKQAQVELKEKTDLMFDFFEIKKGRSVHKIKFDIFKNPNFVRSIPNISIQPENILPDDIIDEDSKLEQKLEREAMEVHLFCKELEIKVYRKTIIKWLSFGKENVIAALKEVENNSTIENPAGFINWRLKNPEEGFNEEEEDPMSVLKRKFIKEKTPKTKITRYEYVPDFLYERDFTKFMENGNFSTEEIDDYWKEHGEEIVKEIVAKNKAMLK